MGKMTISALALLAGAGLAAAQPPDLVIPPLTQPAVVSMPADGFQPFAYARGEALWFHRSNSARVFLGEEISVPAIVVSQTLTTENSEFDFEPGFRVQAGYQFGEFLGIEGLYFGTFHWADSAGIANSNPATNALITLYLTIFGGVDGFVYDYRSDLHNAEINLRGNLNTGLWTWSLLTGVRYLNVSEDFALSGASRTLGIFETTQATTSNNLVGFQVGAGLARSLGPIFGLAARGKAGLFMNFAEEHLRNLSISPAGSNVRFDARSAGASAASVVEAGLFLTCQLFPGISLRGGYEVLFVNRLALAPEQLGAVNFDLATVPTTINPGVTGNFLNDRGSAIYQGPSAGLEVRW